MAHSLVLRDSASPAASPPDKTVTLLARLSEAGRPSVSATGQRRLQRRAGGEAVGLPLGVRPFLCKTLKQRQEFHVAILMETFSLLQPNFFPKLHPRQNGLLLLGNPTRGLENVSD